MRRVVLDTNVAVSSLFGGKPEKVTELWWQGRFVLCVSAPILEEYLEVFERFPESKAEIDRFLAMLAEGRQVIYVESPPHIHAIEADPDDDAFLACAVAARADVIVSGDRHLLSLGRHEGIAILNPAAFLDWIAQSRSQIRERNGHHAGREGKAQVSGVDDIARGGAVAEIGLERGTPRAMFGWGVAEAFASSGIRRC